MNFSFHKLLPVIFSLSFIFNSIEGLPFDDYKKNRMIQDLEVIKHHFEVGYAPAEWKKEHTGWELDVVFEEAKQRILNTPNITTKQFQKIVYEFVHSTQDYHVGVMFCSTERATLPFTVRSIEGKYYIDWIDSLFLPYSFYGIKKGDELVEFDGRPIAEVMEEFIPPSNKQLNPGTVNSRAELKLTQRMGLKGDVVPKGSIMIKTQSYESGKEHACQIRWNYFPEHIMNPLDLLSSLNFIWDYLPKTMKKEQFKLPQLLMANPLHEHDAYQMAGHDRGLGAAKSFVPKLGEVVWEIRPEEDSSDEDEYKNNHSERKTEIADENRIGDSSKDQESTKFDDDSSEEDLWGGSSEKSIGPRSNFWKAYTYKNAQGHIIGYVRIPHYTMTLEEVNQFKDVMQWMEDQTEALVIDQVNNRGGIAQWVFKLASSLTSCPMSTPKHRVKISHNEALLAYNVIEAIKTIESLFDALSQIHEEEADDEEQGGPLNELGINFQELLFYKGYYEHILSEWNAGKTLTDPIHLMNVDMINPNPSGKYTKPILMLINELDFSGGDFMPAILQDNKRVTLFGSRTAGAGGVVESFTFPNKNGILGINFTITIAERINLDKIENLGVTPEIEYQITRDDLAKGYKGYVEAVNQAVQALIDKNASVEQQFPLDYKWLIESLLQRCYS